MTKWLSGNKARITYTNSIVTNLTYFPDIGSQIYICNGLMDIDTGDQYKGHSP